MMNPELAQYVFPLIAIAIVLAVRFRRMSRAQPMKLQRMWVAPAILAVVAVLVIAGHPPSPLGLLICFAALLVGAAIGWHRGKLMRIDYNPETNEFSQRASPAAMLLLVGVLVVRFALRSYLQGNPEPGKLDENALILTDALLLFAVGLISMTRVEMAIRARSMLERSGRNP